MANRSACRKLSTGTAYVTDYSSGTLAKRVTVSATITVVQDPQGVTVDPVTHTVYVAN